MRRWFSDAWSTGVFLFLLFLSLGATTARADVGILLSESTGQGYSRFTSAGHTSVYLSNICPASPVRLRLCRPGEQGSVLSNYSGFGEDKPYEWNIVPLSVFLYGVENADARPLYASRTVRRLLEDSYREKSLKGVCASQSCRSGTNAHWRDMVGSTFQRAIYLFAVRTTQQQDERFIAKYNAQANVNHYNGFTNNCADFAMRAINTYFPGAVRPNYLNDFGMTSPKAIARSLTHYALRHPALHFRAAYFAQQPSDIRRSQHVREGTEVAFHQKKYLIPFLLWHGYELPFCLVSYELAGRFSPERTVAKYASEHETELRFEMEKARRTGQKQQAAQLKQSARVESGRILGSKQDWKAYRNQLQKYMEQAKEEGWISKHEQKRNLFARLDRGTVSLDAEGNPWISIHRYGAPVYTGLTPQTIFAPGSDPQLGYAILLDRVKSFLSGEAGGRERLAQFKQDWALLQKGRRIMLANVASAHKPSMAGESGGQ